ncbi:MAG: ABC transporter substrate-binding protein [Pseudomonadales bacterium]|nr:ABC transporter substrate-binding protein [Pseudomonadales bacterium]
MRSHARLLATALFMLLALEAHAAPAPAQRIVSLNLCTDQLVLQLVPRERIAMLSQLASDPQLSAEAARAGGIARFDGSVESVMEQAPDLILAGSMASLGTTRILQRLGYRVETQEMPESIEDALLFIENTATLVGEPAAGQALRQATQARLNAVRVHAATSFHPLVVVYLPNGLTPGSGTLKHELIALAGWRNLAAVRGISGYGTLSLEELLSQAPALVLFDSVDMEHASMSQQLLHHPAIEGRFDSRWMPTRTWICGGPQIADAAEMLYRFRNALARSTIDTRAPGE